VTVHKSRDLTAGIVALIAADGWDVGEGIRPDGVGWQGTPGASAFVPYVVVHPTPGGVYDGTISAPFGDAQPDYVISSYAATQSQCQNLADQVYEVLTTSFPTVTGRVVQLMMPDVDGGVVRDDDAQPPVFYSPTRWRIYTTTA
jgi:hypothetical protein